jgi:hypothetical protein
VLLKNQQLLKFVFMGKNNKLSDSKNTESMLSDLEKSGSGAECEEQY